MMNQFFPLLHRMVNLETLNLSLIVGERKTFFDGYDEYYQSYVAIKQNHI